MTPKVYLRHIANYFFRVSHSIHPAWVFLAASVFGSGCVLWLRPRLALSDLAAGPEAISLFIPYVATGAYLLFLLISRRLGEKPCTYSAILLYLFVSVFFFGYLREPLWHFYFDDPGRYSNYAHLMLSQGTLWGGDAIGGVSANYAFFVDQPGYRYYLAFMIGILGGEDRLLQLVNMSVYLIALLTFLISITHRDDSPRTQWIAVFFIFSLPYAANNILEGLSEWLAVSFFLIAMTNASRKRLLPVIICLAFAAFVRQNLIISSIFMVIFILFQERDQHWFLLFLGFLGLLCLPLYHNLFYAGEIRFFSTNMGNLLPWGDGIRASLSTLVGILLRKLPQYLAYYETASTARTFIAALFAPLGTGLIIYLIFFSNLALRLTFFLFVIFTIGPTILFGWGYFPRFVFANQAIVLATVPLIASYFSSTPRVKISREADVDLAIISK